MRDKLSPDQISRRALLRGALTGAVALAGFQCMGLKEVVAAVLRTGLPAFSPQALNFLIQSASPSQYHLLLQQGAADPKGFMRSHFYLTPSQVLSLNRLSSQDLDSLKNSLHMADARNLRLHFDCGAGNVMMRKAGGCQVQFQSQKIQATTRALGAPGGQMTIYLSPQM